MECEGDACCDNRRTMACVSNLSRWLCWEEG